MSIRGASGQNALTGRSRAHASAPTAKAGLKEALRHTFAGIDPREVRMMLGENAARLYGFDLDKLAACAAKVGPTPAEFAQPLAEIPRDARSPAFAA